MEVSFEITDAESNLIFAIAERAWKKYEIKDTYNYDFTTLILDITATHCNGAALKLKDMLEADDFNFFHDIWGIYKHINRETGQLENWFWPRFAKPMKEGV
jgi:hypothetical protein